MKATDKYGIPFLDGRLKKFHRALKTDLGYVFNYASWFGIRKYYRFISLLQNKGSAQRFPMSFPASATELPTGLGAWRIRVISHQLSRIIL